MACVNKECCFESSKNSKRKPSSAQHSCLVFDSVKQVRFSKGDTLFSQGESSCCVYALNKGVVKLCDVSHSGREQIVSFATPHGSVVGIRSLSRPVYSVTAIAETEVEACKIRKRSLLAAMSENPEIGIRLIEALNNQVDMSRALMRVAEHHGAKSKIAAFLCLLVPQLNGGGHSVEFPFSRSEMAEILSLTEETVCRHMAALRREGILFAPRGKIEVQDWDRLQAVADNVAPEIA